MKSVKADIFSSSSGLTAGPRGRPPSPSSASVVSSSVTPASSSTAWAT